MLCETRWEEREVVWISALICEWKRETATIPLSFTVGCVNSNSSFKTAESPVSVLTELCWHARLALEWTIKWPFLSGGPSKFEVFVKAFPEGPSLPCRRSSSSNAFRGMLGIQHKRVNWTLNSSHKKWKGGKKNNTTEYLHNRLYLQFLGRKEKEKDTGNIWDKTSGIQKATGMGRQGFNARHQEGDTFQKTMG